MLRLSGSIVSRRRRLSRTDVFQRLFALIRQRHNIEVSGSLVALHSLIAGMRCFVQFIQKVWNERNFGLKIDENA
jgi:hypothetical protein